MPNIVEVLVIAKNATQEGFTAAKTESAGMGATLAKVGMIGGLALAAVGVASVDMASKFQSTTARLVTSAGEANKNLGMVRTGLLNMAGQVGVSANDLAKAMYYVESAGFHGANGLIVLKAAAQGAAAEGADTTTVVQAMTDVLTDYHLKASDAANVTSKMIAAISYGKTNLQDFSGAFASIVPAASAVGISFNDVGAALAEMTNHGFTADRASMDIAQGLRSMLNPTATMKKAFDDYGVSSETLREKLSGPNGLTDGMEYLSNAALKAGKEGTPAFGAALKLLMGTAPGANAALAITGENFKATATAINGISRATADGQGNVKGFSDIQQTMGQRLKEVEAAAESMAIELGNKLLPAISSVLGWLTTHLGVVKDFAIAIGIAVAALAAYAVVTKVVAAAQAILDVVMDMNPFVAIGIAVIAIAALIIKYHTQIWNFIVKTWNDILGFLKQWWPLLIGICFGALGLLVGLIIKYHTQIWTFIQMIWNKVFQFVKGLWGNIYSFAVQWWPLLLGPSGLIVKYHNQIYQFIQKIWNDILGVLKSFWGDIESDAVSAWSTVYSDVRTAWDDIVGFFDGIPGRIVRAVGNAETVLENWGIGVLQGLLNGFDSIWSSVANFFTSLPKKILGWLGIHSPPPWAIEAGQHIASGIGIGIGRAQDRVKTATQALAAIASKTVGGINGVPASGGPTEAQDIAMKMAALIGWTGGLWTDLNNVAMRESGWSMTAQNPSSGAYGIAQFINGPSEYAQYGGNANTLSGQLIAFFNYIKDRYGNPAGAWQHELNFGWYANGGATAAGWAMVGERGRELVKLPGGATVMPAGASAQMVAGGVSGLHITLELGDSFKKTGMSAEQLKDIRYTVRTVGGGDTQRAFGSK